MTWLVPDTGTRKVKATVFIWEQIPGDQNLCWMNLKEPGAAGGRAEVKLKGVSIREDFVVSQTTATIDFEA